jgi:bis(5'-nucleosyl)-tetraphosphatase (symmetrical)
MSRYVIGDLQGHLEKLLQLLDHLGSFDELYFVGDLVNRGPQSLEILRFLSQMQPRPHIVLGNHDLYLLYLVYAKNPKRGRDDLDDILNAPDKFELCDWLRQQDWLIEDEKTQSIIVHAGIAPTWDIAKSKILAQELKSLLGSNACYEYFNHFFAQRACAWSADLEGIERYLVASDYFTRMRFTQYDGSLNWQSNEDLSSAPKNTYPWFACPHRQNWQQNIIFGHWAALMGKTGFSRFQAIDTGLCWGGFLTALNLDTLQRVRI